MEKGTIPLLENNEYSTYGLDDLAPRCKNMYNRGVRFAKWRAVYFIHDNTGITPTRIAIKENARGLAKFASICQQNGIVPIIQPEINLDGGSKNVYISVTST